MHIGLIGGIGPAATDFYYRHLIAAFASGKFPLELTVAHADTPILLKNLASNDKMAQAAIFARLAKRLAVAGADCVAITSIAGHFCMDAFKDLSPLPAVDMIFEVNRSIAKLGLSRVGILGTQTVMETRFYGGVTSAEIVPPSIQDLLDVHEAYVTMATSGLVTEAQRSVFEGAGYRLWKDKGAQAVLLGGTDLVLAYRGRRSDFPLIDCAKIHADAIVRLAIG